MDAQEQPITIMTPITPRQTPTQRSSQDFNELTEGLEQVRFEKHVNFGREEESVETSRTPSPRLFPDLSVSKQAAFNYQMTRFLGSWISEASRVCGLTTSVNLASYSFWTGF